MHYGPHRIQSEGWAVEESAETGIEPGERGQSESGKSNGKRRGHRECKCIRCGSVFKTHKSKAETPKYCSTHCARAGFPQWRQCSGCHAMIGFGTKKSAQILGCVTHPVVWGYWNKVGIERFVPDGRSWANQKKEPWWGDCAADWMDEYRARFFDWSGIWRNAQALKKSSEKYSSLTTEQRKERNRCRDQAKAKEYLKIWKRERMTDPAYRESERLKMRNWYIDKTGGIEDYEKRQARRSDIARSAKSVDKTRRAFRSLMQTAKKGGSDKPNTLIGCTTRQLKEHLERNFKSWMTWGNYGTKWQVDHIIPCASFDHTDPKQRLQCWHFANLTPLCAKKNHTKGANVTNPQMALML